MSTELVAVDIGGTHARFALASIADDGAIALGDPVTLHTKDHASFQTAWEDFARHSGRTLPPAIAIAIAGPVGGEVIRFTNNPWIIRPALIPERLGAPRYTVVNDFGAVGHAVARAPADQFAHLCGPDAPLPPEGTLSIVGPGTGLGVAHVWRDGRGGYRVQATEGGHIDYAPLDGIEDRILARLRHRGPSTINELAEDMVMDRTTMGRNLKPLERDGLIAVAVDPADRRRRALTLTPAGESRYAAARPLWGAAQRDFTTRVGTDTFATLRTALASLVATDLAPPGA